MKRRNMLAGIAAGLGLALSLAFAPAQPAKAQGGITWTTGFQVQNLGTAETTVEIQLINEDGTTAATIPAAGAPAERIGVNRSKTYFPVPNVAAGFRGSAIISADQPVAAILNILGNSGVAGQPFYSEAASGITEGALEVKLPLIQRGNAGFNTWFAVQNTGSSDASVTVEYTPGLAGTTFTSSAVTIRPGASRIFDQATLTNLGDRFVGSAVVKGNQPLAVIVNQVGTGNLRTQLTYSGFGQGSNSVVLPLVQQANGGFFSGIAIQNVGTTSATVNVAFGANTVGAAVPANPAAITLAAGQGTTILVNGAGRYVGSATVTTGGADQQVVVVVNQLSDRFGTAYEGIASSAATSKVSLPLLMANNGGFFTGVQCRNTGTGSATVSLAYTSNTIVGNTFTPTAESATLAAGASVTWLQNANAGIGTQRYVGGGTVTASTGTVVCIVNQLAPGNAGDAFLTYNGVNF
ncbi:MAG: hypothetical protein AB4911_17625 [Oscillochloridaceae bacterium umkhey_bin13]